MDKQEMLQKLDMLWKDDATVFTVDEETETTFEQAVKKLEEELEKTNTFVIPKEAFQLLLSQRMKECKELAELSLLPNRNFSSCMEYMRKRLGKEMKYTSGPVEAGTVLQIMEDYYIKDAEEMAKKKEKEEEEKKKREEHRKQREEQNRKKAKQQKKEMEGPLLFELANNMEGAKDE